MSSRGLFPYWVLRGYYLYKNTVSNIHGILDKSYFRVWNPRFMNRSQWFSIDEIRELQIEGLKKLVNHARRHTAYYKDIPRVRTLDDIEKIPVLTKRLIRENFDRLRATNVPGFIVKTSGTVSRSTTFKDRRLKFDFGWHRFLRWYGRPLNRLCELWGSIDVGLKPHEKWGHLHLPVESLKTRKDAIHFLRLIDRFKPDWIRAYVNPLRFLAHYALEEGIKPEVGVIQTSAEILFPEARREIEEAFQCDVYNQYVSRELGSIAQDCKVHGDLHVNAERYIVEEVNGKLLFTDLLNYAMPLIRYENQDTGELSYNGCPCGRELPTLRFLVGRTLDFLLTKKDEWINVNYFDEPISQYDVFDWVASYQFKQEEKGEVTILLKPWSDSMRNPDLYAMRKIFDERISSDELDISIEIVDGLILSRSGKQITVLTNLSPWKM